MQVQADAHLLACMWGKVGELGPEVQCLLGPMRGCTARGSLRDGMEGFNAPSRTYRWCDRECANNRAADIQEAHIHLHTCVRTFFNVGWGRSMSCVKQRYFWGWRHCARSRPSSRTQGCGTAPDSLGRQTSPLACQEYSLQHTPAQLWRAHAQQHKWGFGATCLPRGLRGPKSLSSTLELCCLPSRLFPRPFLYTRKHAAHLPGWRCGATTQPA